MTKKEKIVDVSITDEMEEAYGTYALTVICGRAIPDLYDGLKPITRRILTAIKWMNLSPEGRYVKSARVTGEVMGKLSPHGDCYGSMVTVASPYNNNHTLVSGWGNFGDSTSKPASSRYTECRSASLSWDVLLDDFDICETRPNYDGSLQEPIRLEAKIPVGLLNGQEGISVGYATKVPPHSLRGVCNSVSKILSGDVKAAAKSLIPDFPSGCQIVKDDGLLSYLEAGRGTLRLRAVLSTEEELPRKKKSLTFTNIPYGTNTEKIGEQAKRALEESKLTGILSISDLSDRSGDCLQFTVKEDFEIESLYRHTDLETKFPCNSLWIDGVKPVELSPVSVVREWYTWRLGRLSVKFQHEKDSLEARCHILEGLLKALNSIDDAIKLIRSSSSKEEAREKLMADPLSLSEIQANSVLEMRLRQLTNMDSDALQKEMEESLTQIRSLSSLIEDEGLRSSYLLNEVDEVGKRHGNARRSSLIEVEISSEPSSSSSREKKAGAPRTPSPRYLKVDKKKGLVEQLKKPRGADIVSTSSGKIIVLGANGIFKKLPSRHNGPVFDEPTELLLATVAEKTDAYLVVFSHEGELRKMVINHSDFSKCTSLGKRLIPEGAEIIHFGTGALTLEKVKGRAVKLEVKSTKTFKPGQKGLKVGNLTEFKV